MSILTQKFVFSALDAEKAGEQFPIDFDNVWKELGYSRKDSAKRAITENLIENEDYYFDSTSKWNLSTTVFSSPQEKAVMSRKEFIFLSCDGYDHFCMMAQTPEGRQKRIEFIGYKKAYRAQLERQFNPAIDPEIEKLRAELNFVKAELSSFKSQLSDEFDFDLDNTHHLSGVAASRKYIIGIVLENFRVGVDFTVDPIARRNKAGLPQFKYYLTQSVHNSLLVALRSIKGVPTSHLPPYIVVKTDEFFKISDKKNKRFPNQKGGK